MDENTIKTINCSTCYKLFNCSEVLICINLNYISWIPNNEPFCEGCKMNMNGKCIRDSEPCWRQKEDKSKISKNALDYEDYYISLRYPLKLLKEETWENWDRLKKLKKRGF